MPDAGVYGYAYDAVGRLKTITSADGASIEQRWQSRLPIEEQYNGTHTVVDPDTSTTAWSGSLSAKLERFYDPYFEMTELKVSGGFHASMTRDRDGLVVEVSDKTGSNLNATHTIQRDVLSGHIAQTQLGTVQTDYGFDISAATPGFGEMQSMQTVAGAVSLYDVQYTFDDAGRIVTQTETLQGATSERRYRYDEGRPLGRCQRRSRRPRGAIRLRSQRQ